MPALRHALASASRTILWIVVTVAAQSLLWVDSVPVAMKALVVATGLLAAWRPALALLVVSALIPFGIAIGSRLFEAYDLVLAEALVLAFLAGWLWPFATARHQPADAVTRSALLFGLVIVATIAVQFALERAWQDRWPAFLKSSARYLTTEYLTARPDVRPQVPGLGFFPPAMMWLESIGLLLASRALCRRDPRLFTRLVATMAIAATGAAAFSWRRVVELATARGVSPLDVVASERVTWAIPSIGASGSYFAMMSLVALGLAMHGPWRRAIGWLVATIVMVTSAWLTKMRVVILAWFAATGAAAAWIAALRLRLSRRAAMAMGAAIAVVMFTGILAVNPFGLLRADAQESLHFRELLARGTGGMIRANPLFGVGITQFKLRFPEYRPPEASKIGYLEDDPHNHLLGVAAELGLVGLVTFVWFFGAALVEASRVLRVSPIDWPRLGALAGLAAFLLTCVSHQPLFVPAAGFTFWILLGAVAGSGPAPAAAPARRSWIPSAILAVAAILIAISVPIRARAAIGEIDFTRVSYGVNGWEMDGSGRRFRWTGDHATLFLPAAMSLVNLPVSASKAGAPNGVDIDIRIDGKPAGHLHLTDEVWHDIRLVAPRTGARVWRVDFDISPVFVPHRLDPSSNDGRELGIRLGVPVLRTSW